MIAAKHIWIIGVLSAVMGFSQPSNDDCENAIRLCPGAIYSGTTTGANFDGSDDIFCATPENTVWYVFTTNDLGGGVTISFTNLSFNPDPDFGQILKANFFKPSGSCGVTPYTPMSECGSSGIDFTISEITVLATNTTYYVQVSGTSDGALNPSECDFDISITGSAVETPDPTVVISIDDVTICQNTDEPINIITTDCADDVNYEWIYNGASVFSSSTNTFTTEDLLIDGGLELIITCGEFCPKTDTSNLLNLVIIPVSAEAGEDQLIDAGEQANLLGSGIGVPTWSPGSSLTSTNTLSTTASPSATTTYFLKMTNGACSATDSVTIYVGEIITIYSAFTPNGDNLNDRWHIVNSDQFPNMEVYIYDRSGQQVFSAVNYTTEDQWWDGTFKGKDLPISAYYYVIRLNDSDKTEYKGYVNLLR